MEGWSSHPSVRAFLNPGMWLDDRGGRKASACDWHPVVSHKRDVSSETDFCLIPVRELICQTWKWHIPLDNIWMCLSARTSASYAKCGVALWVSGFGAFCFRFSDAWCRLFHWLWRVSSTHVLHFLSVIWREKFASFWVSMFSCVGRISLKVEAVISSSITLILLHNHSFNLI